MRRHLSSERLAHVLAKVTTLKMFRHTYDPERAARAVEARRLVVRPTVTVSRGAETLAQAAGVIVETRRREYSLLSRPTPRWAWFATAYTIDAAGVRERVAEVVGDTRCLALNHLAGSLGVAWRT